MQQRTIQPTNSPAPSPRRRPIPPPPAGRTVGARRARNSAGRGPLATLAAAALFATGLIRAADAPLPGRLELDLSGPRWQMEGIRPGQGIVEGFPEHFAEVAPPTYNWNGARVPGDVYTDLWRAGEIDDPHYGRNAQRAKWVMEREWWYRCQFAVPEDWRGKVIRVVFDGVDYACEVWLNGHYLGRHEGMFSPFEFDVTDRVQYGDNARANGLVVRLDPPPRSYRRVAGRKFAWHGDYWRALTPFGIWRPVRLEATGPVRIAEVYPRPELRDNGAANVTVEVELARLRDTAQVPLTARTEIRGVGFEHGPFTAATTVAALAKSARVTLPVRVPAARLWWPWDQGTPHRYEAVTTVSDANGALLDRRTTRFGIRELRMAFNPGYTREEVRHPWTPVINGRPQFLRSANWGGPPDIFYGRNTPGRYRHLIELAREANLNNLRIFGWHPPEVDEFYDLCDELGLTVWQDLIPLASVRLPTDDAFREATYAEAVAVIRRLRRHPSLILLEGGEEIFYGTQGLDDNARFLQGLERAIRPYTDLPYVPTSPLNWPPRLHELNLGGPKDSAHTHFLFYAMGARLLEDYIAEWDYAAIPEFAVSSAPNVESIRRFIPPDELWPPGPSWGYHWADLDTFRALNFQVLGDERTGSLEEFVEATQISQGAIFQWGIEHMRRRKPKSSAISICHFITWAPDMKWGIVDYYGRPKRSYDFVRRACQPLLVSLQCDRRRWRPGETFKAAVWIVNDLPREFQNATLTVQVRDAQGRDAGSRQYAIDRIATHSSRRFGAFEWPVQGRVGDTFQLSLDLRDANGRALSDNRYDFLIGDQEKARQECAALAKKLQALKRAYPTADYYRFFPDLSGETEAFPAAARREP